MAAWGCDKDEDKWAGNDKGYGWGNVDENNENYKKKVTQWEHAGDVDNFVVVNNNNNSPGQKGKGVCSSSSKGIPKNKNNGPQGWKRKRDNFNNANECGGWNGKRVCNNGNGGGEWKGKRVCNNGNQGGEWKGKRVCDNGNQGGDNWNWKGKRDFSNENRGGGWKGGKRASSNEIGGRSAKRGSSNSQVSSGGMRCGRVQTLANYFPGLNGHRVSLHFPARSAHLQKILSEDFSLPGHGVGGFQGQVNGPRPRQVNGPVPAPVPVRPPSPPPVNAVQVYQSPVQDRVMSRKVRVTHSTEGSWVMEVEEFR